MPRSRSSAIQSLVACALPLARRNLSGDVNRAAVQQQLFGQRRLARVRMRDDRKRPPFAHFVDNGHFLITTPSMLRRFVDTQLGLRRRALSNEHKHAFRTIELHARRNPEPVGAPRDERFVAGNHNPAIAVRQRRRGCDRPRTGGKVRAHVGRRPLRFRDLRQAVGQCGERPRRVAAQRRGRRPARLRGRGRAWMERARRPKRS